MADPITTLVTLQPQSISAYNDTLKILVGVASSVFAVVGGIASYLLKQNTQVTERNDREHSSTREALSKHADNMAEKTAELVKKIDALSAELQDTKLEIATQINKVKIVVAKVSDATDQKLSMIPKIKDLLSVTYDKTNLNEQKIDAFIDGLERQRKNKNGGA